MEQHVPILFLDLDDKNPSHGLNISQTQKYTYSDEGDSPDENDSSSNRSSRRSKKFTFKRALKTCSEDCYLKLEAADANYIDLKIISWNDSAQVEICDNNEASFEETTPDADNFALRAVSRWDSSEHKSIHLNQITPADKIVYLVLKLNVKMKAYSMNAGRLNDQQSASSSYSYINLVMRKRICVQICLNSSLSSPSPSGNKLISLNRFKNIVGSTTANLIGNIAKPLANSASHTVTSTGLTYRIISSVPGLLTEVENRESLAIKAATSITEDLINELSTDSNQESPTMEYKSLDTSIGHLEHYAKTIEAVDTILKRDRTQQKNELKKLIAQHKKLKSSSGDSIQSDCDETEESQHSEGSSDSGHRPSSMRKTFSVPNLIKNLTIHQAKQSSAEFKDLREDLAISEITDTTEIDHSPQNIPKSTLEIDQVKKVEKNVDQKSELTLESEENKSAKNANVSKASLEILQLYDTFKKDDEEKARLDSLKHISEHNEAKIASLIFQDFLSVEETPVALQQNETVTPREPTILVETSAETQNSNPTDQFKGSVVSLDTTHNLDTSAVGRAESNLSISSTLTNSSQKTNSSAIEKSQHHGHTKSQQKLNEDELREQLEALPEWVKLDAHVIVSTNSVQNKRGHIRYIGPTCFGTGVWIGVELDQKFGKNDGKVKSERYFTCPEDKGVFVRVDKLTLVVNRVD
jgi:hypothetical protein